MQSQTRACATRNLPDDEQIPPGLWVKFARTDTQYFVGMLAVAAGALQISRQIHITSHTLRQLTRSTLLLGSLQIILAYA